jgi:hypothetical protein
VAISSRARGIGDTCAIVEIAASGREDDAGRGAGEAKGMLHGMRGVRGIVALGLVAMATAAMVAQESGKLKVTVTYKGAGTVDATHEIYLWVFDNPNIGADSIPVVTEVITTNGGTVSLSGLPKEVYLAAAFDEKGDWDGTAGPPPPGTPLTIYGEMGAATAVATGGADAAVTVTFDDSMRMP